MHALAKLTRLEAKVLFLRDPVLLVALAVPIGILLVFGLPGFARGPMPELGGQRPIDTILASIALAISVGVLALGAAFLGMAMPASSGEASVKTHPLRVSAKLDVSDRAAAVAAAYERGLPTRTATATSPAGGPAWPPGRGRGRPGPACAGGAGPG